MHCEIPRVSIQESSEERESAPLVVRGCVDTLERGLDELEDKGLSLFLGPRRLNVIDGLRTGSQSGFEPLRTRRGLGRSEAGELGDIQQLRRISPRRPVARLETWCCKTAREASDYVRSRGNQFSRSAAVAHALALFSSPRNASLLRRRRSKSFAHDCGRLDDSHPPWRSRRAAGQHTPPR